MVKSGAAAIVTSPATLSGKSRASSSAIQPPMDDPTRICGPSVSAARAARASASQSPMHPWVNSPDDCPCPE